MKKIIDYITVSSSGEPYDTSLDKKINLLIGQGWQPFGGIAINEYEVEGVGNLVWTCQAMVKYKD